MRAVVAARQRPRKVRQVARAPRRDVLALAAVRPARGAPDRQHDGDPARGGVSNELVEIVEAVGGVKRVRRACGLAGSGSRPVDGRSHNRGVVLPR